KTVANGDGQFHVEPAENNEPAFFTSYEKGGRFISYYGDNHPVYAGNVVKAMASAKFGYPHIVKFFESELAKLEPSKQDERDNAFRKLASELDNVLRPTVVR